MCKQQNLEKMDKALHIAFVSNSEPVRFKHDCDNCDILSDFCELCGINFFDDEGIEVTLKNGYICIWASCIVEYFDIDIVSIFDKDDGGIP